MKHHTNSTNMKKIAACLPFLLLCATPLMLPAQIIPMLSPESSEAYPIVQNDADHPCISPAQYALIEKQCAENLQRLGIARREQPDMMSTPLNWPLRSANGLTDCKYYGISAYVDQNTVAGAVSDYNCGTKTYDGHKGTDISIWPFPFYKMDHNQVEVIAAAAGTIINKVDGNFDKNCGANALTANYIVIQHADGSTVLYFHLKKNSLTAKAVGQTVAVGEYLGVVGSSGNSSGPHLHFEVWSGSTNATRIDPYAGPCNSLNATSWWASQSPYSAMEILKTSVHTTDAVLPTCPETETLNESSCFSSPFQGPGLPAGYAKFYIFMRYETVGMTTNLSILNPDGSTFTSWSYPSTASYNGSLKSWSKVLPTNTGTYTFVSTLNGVSCSKTFEIINASITPVGSTTICQGNSVTLNASPGSTYLWSNGATTQTITVATAGNYAVTVTNANGCSDASTATAVTVLPPLSIPSITPSGATTFCQGNSVTLTASAGSTYHWSNNATTSSITVSTAGNYVVTVTNANGCSAVSSATVVTVNPLPAIPSITASGATTFCQGNSVTLTASAGSTYHWSNNATTSSITVSAAGNYVVTVTNANGCSAVSSATVVTVNPLPATPSITPSGATTFCQGNSVTLTASAGSTYHWSNNATTSSITVSAAGNYVVTVTNANGCSAVSSATVVTVNPLPATPSITPSGVTTFCQGNTVTLTASAGSSYHWSNNATTSSITVSAAGNYVVTVTNANGCSAVSSATVVTVNPLPATPSITANGTTLISSATTGNQWYLNGTIIAGATAQNLPVTQNGQYTVVVTNANGCTATSVVFNYTSTGTENIIENPSVIVFPNPNNGKFTVEIAGGKNQKVDGPIEIFNLLGYKIAVATTQHPVTDIDISTHPNGIYWVCVRTEKGQQMFKVLKQ